MNFQDLKSEVARRGFDYLSDAALGRYVNDGYLLDICETEDWRWLQATQTGPLPMTIEDLRSVLYVVNRTSLTKLVPLREAAITDMDINLLTVGEPIYFYLPDSNVVSGFPVSVTEDFQVAYVRTPPILTGTDVPEVPERFHTLICDAAVARAYEDDDEWDNAAVATERFQTRLERMRETYLAQQHDRPDDFIVQTTDL